LTHERTIRHMKKIIITLVVCLLTWAGSIVCAPRAEANGWATAGKILAGVAGADLLFNGSNSMVGRTVSGVGTVFTGGYGYARPAAVVYNYSPPPPRRCWEEIRRVPAYDAYGNFVGYFDKRVSVCSEY
jgi:hypothetical protein